MIFRRELGNVFLSGNAKEINIATSEHEKKLRRNTVSAKGTRYTARCALSVCTLGCAVGLQLSRTPWSQTQTAGGFCFQSLDLGLKLYGIFQDIVPVTLFGGEEPVKCTVSRHNTFSLSYFVFITRPPTPSPLHQTLWGLPFALVPLFAPFSIIILLIWGHSYWCWLLSGHVREAEKAHTSPASPLFFTVTHVKTVLSFPATTGCLCAIAQFCPGNC